MPGVLVVHHAGGLGDEIQDKTRRLASLGYCAFALDMFGTGEPVTDGLRRIGEIVADLKRWRGLATAGLEALAGRPECDPSRMGAIGYCFGGTSEYVSSRRCESRRTPVSC
jgi:dienelactone hydrolase